MSLPDILITLGDPAGIGAEVTAKALLMLPKNALGRFLVIGNGALWESLKAPPGVAFEASDSLDIPPGFESPQSGQSALAALDRAIALLKKGEFKSLVTAPLSKKAVNLAGLEGFHGHTNYLGDAFNACPEMVFTSPRWSVLLATVHVPLNRVSALLTPERLKEALKNAAEFQKKYALRGALALCGLNPHAGEGGTLGTEEQEVFLPVIEQLRAEGLTVEGPFAGDTIFREAEAGRYAMLVSPYHDQALTAFKILHFIDGINVSFGLPFLRCSPDHGCAFSIAGKGAADARPMLNSLLFTLKNSPQN